MLEYADADGHTYLSEGRVRAAKKATRLAFDLSVLDADGAVMFTGHYDVTFADDPEGTRLHVDLAHHRHHRRGRPRDRRHRDRLGPGARPARHAFSTERNSPS